MTTEVDTSRFFRSPRANPVENLREMLRPLEERNKWHKIKELNGQVSSDTAQMGMLLAETQECVNWKLATLAHAADEKEPVLFNWLDENLNPKSFFAYLEDQSWIHKNCFLLCEKILREVRLESYRIPMKSSINLLDLQNHKRNLIIQTGVSIGKVVFAADRLTRKIGTGLDPRKFDRVMDFIEDHIKTELQKIEDALKEGNLAVNRFSLQDKDSFFSITKPKVIADLLLTYDGKINLGMITLIKNQFFKKPYRELEEYDRRILYVLKRIDASWQKEIDGIQVPANEELDSNAMIRMDLSLSPSYQITKRDCQIAVLAALFSLSGGRAGDQFAISWAVKGHLRFLKQCIEDFSSLIHESCLSRMINGVVERFFFEPAASSDALDFPILVNPGGNIQDFPNAPFWHCPNLIAACRQIGIADLEKCVPELLKEIFGSEQEAKLLTWDILLQACANLVATAQAPASKQLAIARYAFSLDCNRLVRAWEMSLASMSEAREEDYVRTNINSSVMTVVQKIFDHGKKGLSLYQKSLVEEMKTIFQKNLNRSMRLLYQECIPRSRTVGSDYFVEKSFKLYQKQAETSIKGDRIATPEQLQKFVGDALEISVKKQLENIKKAEDIKMISSIANALRFCIYGQNFIRNVLWAYEPENLLDPNPVEHHRELDRTPMTTLQGEKPWEVMAIATERDFIPNVRTLRPNDAGEFLKWLLYLADWDSSHAENLMGHTLLKKEKSKKALPGFEPAFKNDEFQDFLSSGKSPDLWIKEELYDIGLNVSNFILSNDSKILFFGQLKEWISIHYLRENHSPYLKEIDEIFASLLVDELSVKVIAQRAHDSLRDLLSSCAGNLDVFSYALDRILLKSLPENTSKFILYAAVCFANSSLKSNTSFFCCFFNPRTEKIAFGKIDEKRSYLEPIDQRIWMGILEWGENQNVVNK